MRKKDLESFQNFSHDDNKKVFDHFVRNPVDLKPKVDHRLNDLSRLNPQNYQLFHGFSERYSQFYQKYSKPRKTEDNT